MSSRDRYPPKTSLAIRTRQREPDKSSTQSDLCCSLELNHAVLVLSGQRRTAPGSSQGFLLNLWHRWSFGSLPLPLLACLFGDAWLIEQTLLEGSWTGLCHHWINHELTLTGKMTENDSQTISLFDSVKLLWHNQYCIKCYINKGDLTRFYIP